MYETLNDGFIIRLAESARGTDIAVGPRLAILPDGDVLCSFMLTAGTGTNDFVPVLCRSRDRGRTWSEPVPVWPSLSAGWSLFVSVSASGRRLFLYGSRTPIDVPGESFWNEATQGLKQNELVWAVSDDGGRSWTDPSVIPMPIPGSAEAPGALCVIKSGRWLAPYSPCNTFDPRLPVDRSQVVVVFSDDEGRTWNHSEMLRFADPATNGAEAWLTELSDGRVLGTCWHVPQSGPDLPNAFALSHDAGRTWTPTASTGIMGQSTALAGGADGRAVFVYNQRKHGRPGVWLAVVRPTDEDFGIEQNQIVWGAETPTQSGSSGDLTKWTDFSFGEPSAVRLEDGSWLVALWSIQPSGTGIRYVRVRL